jgi:hypothetical protein
MGNEAGAIDVSAYSEAGIRVWLGRHEYHRGPSMPGFAFLH